MHAFCVCVFGQSVSQRERECKFKRHDGTAGICNIILDEPPCLIDDLDLGLQMYTASSSSLAQCSGVGTAHWRPAVVA